MHKKVLLICLIFLLIGCKEVNESDDYIALVNDSLNEHAITTHVSKGYKYYVPRGVKKVQDYDYNQVFLVDDSYMYLYVDIISYFYKKELQVSQDVEYHYYQPVSFNGNTGYLKVEQREGKYYVTMLYHYSKIEVYTTSENLNKIITLSSIILNSIDYNDKVIEKVLEGDLGKFSEFTYEVDKPDGVSSNFSHILEEYVQKEEEKEKEQLPDE